jgi:hypothetical protein
LIFNFGTFFELLAKCSVICNSEKRNNKLFFVLTVLTV